MPSDAYVLTRADGAFRFVLVDRGLERDVMFEIANRGEDTPYDEATRVVRGVFEIDRQSRPWAAERMLPPVDGSGDPEIDVAEWLGDEAVTDAGAVRAYRAVSASGLATVFVVSDRLAEDGAVRLVNEIVLDVVMTTRVIGGSFGISTNESNVPTQVFAETISRGRPAPAAPSMRH